MFKFTITGTADNFEDFFNGMEKLFNKVDKKFTGDDDPAVPLTEKFKGRKAVVSIEVVDEDG